VLASSHITRYRHLRHVLSFHASLLPHACNSVATRLKALVCARLVLFRPLHPDLKIWGHGTASALSAHGSDRSAVRDGSPSLLEERIVTLFGHLQAFSYFRTGIDTPRAVHRTGLAEDEWHFMRSAVNAFSEACEACRWLASPYYF
jgi:hypothetical protein